MRTAATINNKAAATIGEKLTAQIEGKKQERMQILTECKKEKAKTQAEIEALKEAQAEAENPDRYRDITKQINDKAEYIEYLDRRAKQTNERPALSRDEYGEIDIELTTENRRLTDAAAGQILKKYDELMQLMEPYAEQANELQKVLNKAQEAHFGRRAGGHFWHTLEDKRPDKNSFFGKFCRAYFDFYAGRNGIR